VTNLARARPEVPGVRAADDSLTSRPAFWLWVAVVVATSVALVDAIAGASLILIGLLSTAPLLAGVRARPRQTALVGAYATALGIVLGVPDEFFGSADHLVRVAVVVVVSALAVWMAILRERALGAAAESRNIVHSVFESALDCIISMDANGRIVDLNPAAERTFGLDRERVVGEPLCDLIIPERFRSAHREGLERVARGEPGRILDERVEFTAVRSGGEEFPVELTVTRASEEPLLFTGFARDVTERRMAQDERAREERRSAFLGDAGVLLESSLDYEAALAHVARLTVPRLADWAFVEILEADGSINRLAMAHSDPAKEALIREYDQRYPINPEAAEGSAKVVRTGRPELMADIPDEMLELLAEDPEHLRILKSLGFRSAMVVPLRARGRVIGDIALVCAESGRRYDEDDLALAQELALRCALAIDNARLYEETRRNEALLRDQALSDPLTGLANRTLFLDRLGLALTRTGRRPGEPALLFFDLDGFKAINDEFGHHVGDQLLIAVATRVTELLRAEDTVSRFGGDEFAILCEDVADEPRAIVIAERVVATLRVPFDLDDWSVELSASLGVVFARGPEETPESMLRNADAAMYEAKRKGDAGYQVFGNDPPGQAGAPPRRTALGRPPPSRRDSDPDPD